MSVTQRAILLQHPSAKVILDDPRDPPHLLPAEDGYIHGPLVTAPGPIVVQAPPRTEQQVCVCGQLTRHHFALDGRTWIGCAGATHRETTPRNPERWNDAHPAVTCAVRAAMMLKCGPAMEQHCTLYSHDELLAVAQAIAKAAMTACLLEIKK